MRAAVPAALAASLLWAAPARAQSSCTNPTLCGLTVASTIGQADLAVAIDVVLVGDGFVNMNDWHAAAAGAISAFQAAPSNMFGRVANLYNFHVVDVVSASTDVTNADLTDTALGMRLSGPFITIDQGRANLAALNAPDVDVVVAIGNSGSGRANANYPSQLASGGTVRLSLNTSVITHELGHALFHLADEYEEAALCGSPSETGMMREPNVTTDGTCYKWAGVAGGACVQGGRYCSSGVYRSAGTCLMRTNNGAACPACSRELDDVLRQRRAGRDWAPPWVVAAAPGASAAVAGPVALTAHVHDDWFSPTALAFEVDGAYVGATSGVSSAQLTFDTTRLPDGPHLLRAFGADARGATSASREVTFSTLNQSDLVAPVVNVSAPAAGATVSGVVGVVASVAAPAGDVRELVLRVDGQVVAGASGVGSLYFSWDTSAAALGAHSLDARAVDYSENVGTSAAVGVTVAAPPPPTAPFLSLSRPRDGTAVGPYFALEWAAEGGVAGSQGRASLPVGLWVDGVEVTPDPLAGRQQTAVIDARAWSLGPHQLRLRTRSAPAFDSPPVLVWRSAVTAPQAFIVSPERYAWLRAPAPVVVVAADDAAIASITLRLDGASVGTVAGGAGSVVLAVAGRSGCGTLVAEVLSSDGGVGASAPISVCFDDLAPAVVIDAPRAGAAIAAGPLVVRPRITEVGSGVERLRLEVDGVVVADVGVGGALATALAPGPHGLVVVARDRAGNEGRSASVTVTAGTCTAGGCDDGDACTVDRCGPSGACVHARTAGCCTVATDCADGDACTTEACVGGQCTRVAVPGCCNHGFDCDDGDRCTSDVCSGPGGTCAHASAGCCASAADCSDGRACTTDSCIGAPSGVCAHDWTPGCCGSVADCDDGDPCTAESCAGGTCGHTPIAGCCRSSLDCDDGDRCTQDLCTAGACGHASIDGCCATAADCASLNPCVTTACGLRGACEATPVAGCCVLDLECADADPCTVHACSNHACVLVSATAGCADAGVVDAGGGVVDAGGGVVDAGGRDAAVDGGAGRDAAPEDAATGRDGAADGSVVGPDGSVVAADGAIVAADGSVVAADGAVSPPDGSAVSEDGSVVREDASAVSEDGSVVREDASAVSEDGSVVREDASAVSEDGSVVREDASAVSEDGSAVSEDASAVSDATALLDAGTADAAATPSTADATVARDVAMTAAEGSRDPITGSCSCRAERPVSGSPWGPLSALLLAALVRRARARIARRAAGEVWQPNRT